MMSSVQYYLIAGRGCRGEANSSSNYINVIGGFVGVEGTGFVVNGSAFYFNGFNAYWLMLVAANANATANATATANANATATAPQRGEVTAALEQAAGHGLTLGRTWAFSDGGAWPLQYSPGSYNEAMFQGLDFVVSEAGKHGIYLILSLVNNYKDFGGRPQYVEWARDRGENVTSDDDFYRNEIVKGYYKNHVKTVVTRVNTISRVAYRDDPTILAWELINEPRCEDDLSGATLQGWIAEMGGYVKSIDRAHLVEIGMEGFYGAASQFRKQFNPNGLVFGTDFVPNNQVQGIDFATIHAYPGIWLSNWTNEEQLRYLRDWTQAHVEDSAALVKKPLLFTEFGKSLRDSGSGVPQRDALLEAAFDSIYGSAQNGGPLAGGLFWQLLTDGMDGLKDGYEIILSLNSSTSKIISNQSLRLWNLAGKHQAISTETRG
ncbi:Mannan endo-1,4-beta-mannosidase 1 [Ananas comosus]|uniref:mannan endo-1,4-beta-mannosidase n=1 Tax=Ananas comosus TaxID=4615 RepID=A0A199UCY8_ANACO|nr:Mannan endo-1,4-beta-mannosidase 1 [Ananas comosus]